MMNDMRGNKGQLQTLEPILITIFLALIIGILLLVYVRINSSQQTTAVSTQRNQEDVATLARIATLPELKCSNAFENCIDEQKAKAFSFMMADAKSRIFYHAFFGDANISISAIGLDGNNEQIPLYYSLNSTNVKTTITYFTIYDPVTNTRRFATLMITRPT